MPLVHPPGYTPGTIWLTCSYMNSHAILGNNCIYYVLGQIVLGFASHNQFPSNTLATCVIVLPNLYPNSCDYLHNL